MIIYITGIARTIPGSYYNDIQVIEATTARRNVPPSLANLHDDPQRNGRLRPGLHLFCGDRAQDLEACLARRVKTPEALKNRVSGCWPSPTPWSVRMEPRDQALCEGI